eukprot:m.48275 g.48275  ORF g.48275 m.48275 type:complete len:332 (+) comp12715_c0_seq1:157-1152(+)
MSDDDEGHGSGAGGAGSGGLGGLGGKGGNNDLTRLGIFKEMSYLTVGDPYKDARQKPFNEPAYKGKQMLASIGNKVFDKTTPRLFEGEAYTDKVKERRRQMAASKTKNIAKDFVPVGGNKTTGGSGNYFNTFGGKVDSFSPAIAEKEKAGAKEPNPRNFYTKPSPAGTGFGFPGVTIGAPPEYISTDYDAAHRLALAEKAKHKAAMRGGAFKLSASRKGGTFDANPYKEPDSLPKKKDSLPPIKKPLVPFKPTNPSKCMTGGGKYFGAFDPYPAYVPPHPVDEAGAADAKESKRHAEPVFKPVNKSKPTPTCSIAALNAQRSVNNLNFSRY